MGAAVHSTAGRRLPVCRHSPGDRWHVNETYVKVNGVWRYVYRVVDHHGQVIDVLVSGHRDADAVYPAVLDELIPQAWHHAEQYANNPIEAEHSRLKHRLRPMRGYGPIRQYK